MLLKTLVIENFRGITKLDLALDRTTVFIGENNTGKTSILEAISLCLARGPARRAVPFTDYDYHLGSKDSEPTTSPPISITFIFSEEKENDWPEAIPQGLDKVIQSRADNLSEVRLRFTSGYDATAKDYVYAWAFLNLDDKPLVASTRQRLSELQQFVPVFFLAAVRDAAQHFHAKSPFWGSFVRNLQLDAATQAELEEQIAKINQTVVDSHKPFEEVKHRLSQAVGLVALHPTDSIGVEAVPARAFDMLSRAQVKLAATTTAKLPISQHGAGTQSLAVMFLFEAFLNSQLAEAYDKDSEPLLALEEPESHLHPSAIRSLWSTLEGLKGQKLIATHSGDLISAVPLRSIRRLAKKNGHVQVFSVPDGLLSTDEERWIGHTIRSQRGSLMFARCWLLVEGATEYWFLPAAARHAKVDLQREGIAIIEYAQIGGRCEPLIKLANALGIEWHLLADGDTQGNQDTSRAVALLNGAIPSDRVTQLKEPYIEHTLWHAGYSSLYEQALVAGRPLTSKPGDPGYPEEVLGQLKKKKTALAVAVADALVSATSPGLPPVISTMLATVATVARR